MTEGLASIDALVDSGVLAYKNREFKAAIDDLQKVLDMEPRHWRAKLYLAMSYFHGGEVFAAFRHFTYLKDNCTDQDIRDKATAAIRAMNDQITPKGGPQGPNVTVRSAMPEMTCTMKKPGPETPAFQTPADKQDKPTATYDVDVDDDALELEWVDTRTERL